MTETTDFRHLFRDSPHIVYAPSPDAPNEDCCSQIEYLCDDCKALYNLKKGRDLMSRNSTGYLPLPEPVVNLDRGDYADNVDYLPLPNTMQKILALNAADSKRRQAPVSNSVERDEDLDYLPLPRMDF